jgi:hypothetical protein
MTDITIHSEPGQFPAIELQPGNTLAVRLAGTDFYALFNVPLVGFAWVELHSLKSDIAQHITIAPIRLQDRLQQLAEAGGG